MKLIVICAILLTACTFHPIVKPPPVHIAPHVKPAMLGGEQWPSLLPTPTVTP